MVAQQPSTPSLSLLLRRLKREGFAVGPLHECGGVLICCRVVNVWIWRRVVDVWHGEWQLMWEDINTSDGGGSWIIQL